MLQVNYFAQSARQFFLTSVCLLGSISLVGCQGIYKGAGNGVKRYSATQIVPFVSTGTDINQACLMASSMTPVLFSFERVGTKLSDSRILMSMLSGHCASQQAWDAQLAYTAAIKQQQQSIAQDARIVEKRALILAAQRYWSGYQGKRAAFAQSNEGGSAYKNVGYKSEKIVDKNQNKHCPQKMDASAQMLWLVGMLDGLLAVMSDSLAERAANIPLSAIGEIAEDAQCLQDERSWGMASAVPAMVAALKSGDATPYLPALRKASQLGFNQGVRLAAVLEANIYVAQGNDVALKDAIRRYVGDVKQPFKVNADYALFDAAATEHVQAMSDQLWMRATGHRTPVGLLGKFWDDKTTSVGDDVDLSDVL
jgi:hypothetical protein